MTFIFADAFYWIALLNPKDTWHETVINYRLEDKLITTDVVLDELLNFFSKRGSFMRQKAIALYENIQLNPQIKVVITDAEIRRAATDIYKKRLDKGYSITDCISMVVMKQRGITDVLTNDRHFTQEGFNILFH